MTRHDPDLIAALAAGELAPAEAAALEKQIAADPRAAAELAAQRFALQALRDAPSPVLSAEERAELRQAVAAALHLEAAPATPPAARRIPWRPLAVAAAALTALAITVPLISLLSVGGGDQSALTTLAQAALTTRSEEDEGGSLLGAPEQAPGAVTLPADADDMTESALDDWLAHPEQLLTSADPTLTACAAEARDLLGEAVPPAAVMLPRGDRVVWFVTPDGTSISHLAVFDPVDCRLLETVYAGP
jgi:hypothetical protein